MENVYGKSNRRFLTYLKAHLSLIYTVFFFTEEHCWKLVHSTLLYISLYSTIQIFGGLFNFIQQGYTKLIKSGNKNFWIVTKDSILYKYSVLAWNSRWRSPIGLTQSDLMTSLSHGTADWFSPVSVANELSAQHSNIWLVLAVAVEACFRNPPPSPAPPV